LFAPLVFGVYPITPGDSPVLDMVYGTDADQKHTDEDHSQQRARHLL